MTRPTDHRNTAQRRTQIANAAARLIAEHGLADYAQAKRKAARSLGLPDSTPLPENAEVDSELRSYQRLFQNDEQSERIAHLRRKAVEMMTIVQRFNAYLTGPVLDGSAGRYAEIDIQLFTDSAKDVEIFLLNQHLDFAHSVPRTDRAEAVLTIDDDDAVINLIVYPAHQERVSFKTRDGRVRPHARRDAVLKLIDAASR
jgi:phage tail protein X